MSFFGKLFGNNKPRIGASAPKPASDCCLAKKLAKPVHPNQPASPGVRPIGRPSPVRR